MRMFQTEGRTAESYVAGLGASGALMASAIVVFVVLLGIVTFNAWPEGGLLGIGANNVAVDTANVTGQEPQPEAPSLTQLLGGPVQSGGTLVAARPVSTPGGGAGGGNGLGGGGSGTGNDGGGGSTGTGGGGGGGGGGDDGGGQSLLGSTVSNTGNQVQGATNSVGSQVDGATGTNLGSSLLDPIGSTVNQTVQGVSNQLP
jgi:hypothetical protein